jgi:hypothetical protein
MLDFDTTLVQSLVAEGADPSSASLRLSGPEMHLVDAGLRLVVMFPPTF